MLTAIIAPNVKLALPATVDIEAEFPTSEAVGACIRKSTNPGLPLDLAI